MGVVTEVTEEGGREGGSVGVVTEVTEEGGREGGSEVEKMLL